MDRQLGSPFFFATVSAGLPAAGTEILLEFNSGCKNGSALLWRVHQSNYECSSRERSKKYSVLDCDEALSGLFREDVK